MKKHLQSTLLLLLCLFATTVQTNAQCTVDTTVTGPGVHQNTNYCFPQNDYTIQVWQFKNFDEVTVFSQTVTVDSISIDSIINLPAGLNWTTNKYSSNLYANSERGCLLVFGTCTGDTGIYELDLAITAYINGLPVQHQHYSALGTHLYVHVTASGAACTMDTTQANQTSTVARTPSTLFNGIKETDSPINSLSNYPNPFNNTTDVVFVTLKNAPMTFTVYDLLGKAVRQQNIQTVSGRNVISFNRKGLQSGVYFYTITDGSQTYTHKMVITE